jgi:hypothetical protein
MPAKDKIVLINEINADLADNNAGLISAADVRNNMVNIVDSINPIVANGNFDSETPFINNVRLKHDNTGDGKGGVLIVESGIAFSINGGVSPLQTEPFLGVTGVDHNQLSNLQQGDPHTQYLRTNGARTLSGNFGLGKNSSSNIENWINSSGSQDPTSNGRGLQFVYKSATQEDVNVGGGTTIKFLKDESYMTSARGVAKAWIRFDSSDGGLSVQDSFNVSGISRISTGKFNITFNSGVFKNNDYIAIGSSNARNTANSQEDFSEAYVGTIVRTGNDGTTLRSVTFAVYDKGNNNFVDGKINELIAFGTEPGGSASSLTITNTTTTPAP